MGKKGTVEANTSVVVVATCALDVDNVDVVVPTGVDVVVVTGTVVVVVVVVVVVDVVVVVVVVTGEIGDMPTTSTGEFSCRISDGS